VELPDRKTWDNVEESGATGAAGFCATGSASFGAVGIDSFASASFGSASFTTEIGKAGFATKVAWSTVRRRRCSIGRDRLRMVGEPLAKKWTDCRRAAASAACWQPRRSVGKRMPQKPTTDSVNSSSTYPLTLR